MFGPCNYDTWGFLGTFDVWGWIGLILTIFFLFALLAGLTRLAVWIIRRARVPVATVHYATGQPTAKEILQAQYARGEITREQYEHKKQVTG